MGTKPLIGCLLATALCGCSASVDVSPMLRDFDRYDSDVQTLANSNQTGPALKDGRAKRAQAGDLVADGKDKDARPVAEKALADARLALESERMNLAARRAESCRLAVEQARTKWREAAYVLEQTEEFLGTTAQGSIRPPQSPSETTALPMTTLESDTFPPAFDQVVSQWRSWRQVAREHRIAAADLESVFARSRAATQAEKVDAVTVEHHTYLAARSVQALECRVRAAVSERECLGATELASRFGDARADALRATLDLERGMQDHLRGELDQLRAEAQTRQDELYAALSQMEGKFASIRRDARGTIVSLADILFDFDEATLRRSVEFNLVKIATILNQFGEMKIAVEGHTDSIGTDEYNLDLSQRRAEAVYSFLISQEVDESRIDWEGYGETRPVADNETEEGRQQNRRVDLVIQDVVLSEAATRSDPGGSW